MSVFTAIGDTLNASSWFHAIQWPFWTLLVILAFCGVHTAHFGKKSLLCLAVQGCLKLAIIYMVAAAGYIWAPSVMKLLSQLPFLSVSSESLTLVNPLGLLGQWDTALPRVVVRLYFLLFFLNAVSIYDYQTPNFIGWLAFQILVGGVAVFLYSMLSASIGLFWPGGSDVFCKLMALLLVVVFAVILVLKFVFTFIIKGGNNTYQNVYTFLTKQKFGQLFTVSVLSFLICVAYLVIADLRGHSRLVIDSVNAISFLINGFMCTMTLYVFNRYYNG